MTASAPTAARRATPMPALTRLLLVTFGLLAAFTVIAGQLLRLGLTGADRPQLAISEPIATSWSRPDIVDRNGRLVATDIVLPSLFADPGQIQDPDEVVERLRGLLPAFDERTLRRQLADPARRFVWIRRGVTPALAERIHDLGLPGLHFRSELKRVYTAGHTAAHLLGQVDLDNKGVSGLELWIDDTVGVEAVHSAVVGRTDRVRLTLDLSVQHAVREELQAALRTYRAEAASAVVLDAHTGDIVAAVSLPDFDPNRPPPAEAPQRRDHLTGGVYELGSIFKVATLAMMIDAGLAGRDAIWDARQPLTVAGRTIDDLHGQRRMLTAEEVFVHSSNVGTGQMALTAGGERQRAFLTRIGLIDPLRSEAGTIAPPLLPKRWGDSETVTISYGHGLAVAPLQFAAAMAGLVNGGTRVVPRLVVSRDTTAPSPRVVSPETSRAIAELLRLNVALEHGTGRRARVPGLEIGGKTGSADIPRGGGYADDAVVASFIAAFPMPAPRYVTLLTLFQPQATAETKGRITASVNAAPASGRMIERIAPLLGAMPPAASAR